MVILAQNVPQPAGMNGMNGNGNGSAVDVSTFSTKTLHVRGDSDGSFQLQIAGVKYTDAVDADFHDAGAAITHTGTVTISDLALSARLVVSGQGAAKTPTAQILGLYATEGG